MSQDSWNTTGWVYLTDDQDLLDELSTKDEMPRIMDNRSSFTGLSKINSSEGISKIDVPGWADIDAGYRPIKAERIGNTDRDFFVVVTYWPTSTLGIGYKRVFIVEESTQKPFPRTKEMWGELRSRSIANRTNKAAATPYVNIPIYAGLQKGSCIPDNITICDKGELRSAFGVPKTEEIYGIVFELCSIYNDWRKFPDETDYAVIETLKEAKNQIRNMQHHTKEFELEIDESRRLIKEQQERIAELEGRMNKLYEEGADAMNLLEDHGVKFDLNGEIQEDEDATFPGLPGLPGLPLSVMDQSITMPYDPGSLIAIDHSSSNYSVATSANWGTTR